MGGDEAFVEDIETARRRFEAVYLRALLAKAGHNVAKAARLAGVTRQGLYRLLHRNGLGPQRHQTATDPTSETNIVDDEGGGG
jgi:DNA-binding NtrC family response regulator